MKIFLGQVEFNPSKKSCTLGSQRGKYIVHGKTLNSVDVQRNPRIQVHIFLKVATEVDRVVTAKYGMLAFMGQGI